MNSNAPEELKDNPNAEVNLSTAVIILTLLHPLQAVPVQSWTFDPETVIRIGRSTDNEVILYSAVVSRHHVEIRPSRDAGWEVVNLGANGTYIDGKRITKIPVSDGIIIRLASSGPQIQIRIEEGEFDEQGRRRAKRPLPPLGEDKSKDTLIT
ncbi:FHA domain-containing protein [Spirulina major CS-329]|uniref:FHA domain-containing protein n=1 Tax=Spirulina TaxID=1154 RepID=UPI00232E1211|nr:MULTISPECIES: FHA domain-containing protein [Spirulina]MDB9496401.1 FHA domain-containing protein [Spirulina subsalsa CS-330]MDB9503564.1 FHA domain-containing protein [Spirulina major CS-329]